jgi:hypothetical protein
MVWQAGGAGRRWHRNQGLFARVRILNLRTFNVAYTHYNTHIAHSTQHTQCTLRTQHTVHTSHTAHSAHFAHSTQCTLRTQHTSHTAHSTQHTQCTPQTQRTPFHCHTSQSALPLFTRHNPISRVFHLYATQPYLKSVPPTDRRTPHQHPDT